MNNIRIIPRIDIKGAHLVKGIHLEGLRVLGNPEEFAKFYYENGADELIYQDVVASLYERNSLHEMIKKMAQEIFVPLTVGGGIRTLDDIYNVLRTGADKVSINTAAIKKPAFISEAAKRFGSSTIVVAIELIKQPGKNYLAFTDNGREHTGVDALKWAKEVENLGAGELMITSVDREGTGRGFDVNLLKKITDLVKIPVIAHGGAGSIDDVVDVATQTNISGIAIASIFHYNHMKELSTKIDNTKEGNIDFLLSGRSFSNIETASITDVKKSLAAKGINIRF